uniref:Uncharacterized protein n=1 Tax=Clytia hemisphaerica TaxID=252671 RepID=A0A7M6DP83_9CNID
MVEGKKVGVLIACAAVFILLSASTGGVGWSNYEALLDGGSVELKMGLFRSCRTEKSFSTFSISNICSDFKSEQLSSKHKAIQAFMILSVLASIAAVVCVMFIDKISAKLISWLMIDAFISALIGLAIFTESKENSIIDIYDYGWAYALGWVGAIAALIVGVVVSVAYGSS